MKKILFATVFALALCVLCSCASSDDGVYETVPTLVGGEGESLFLMPEDESKINEIVIKNLNIDVAEGGRYEIVVGSHRKVSCDIKCDSEMYSQHGLAVEYKGNKMIVSADPGKEYQLDSFRMMIYGRYKKITLENCNIDLAVTATEWRELEVVMSGEGDCTVSGLDAQTFNATLSGESTLAVSGTATAIDVRASGESELDLKGLVSGTAKVNVSGESEAVVTASSVLDAVASGESSVVYYGDPKLNEKTSGSAKISKGE